MPQAVQECDVEVRVRYAECDAMGYLHHAKYFEYFEIARTELLRQNGYRYRDLEAEGVCFVVYKCSCTYRLPIRYDDPLEEAFRSATEESALGRLVDITV